MAAGLPKRSAVIDAAHRFGTPESAARFAEIEKVRAPIRAAREREREEKHLAAAEKARLAVEQWKSLGEADRARKAAGVVPEATGRQLRRTSRVPWADQLAILAIYKKAQRLSEKTSALHEVDHIIPLVHRLVCGLHVDANLRIVVSDENRVKSNRWMPITLFGDDSLTT